MVYKDSPSENIDHGLLQMNNITLDTYRKYTNSTFHSLTTLVSSGKIDNDVTKYFKFRHSIVKIIQRRRPNMLQTNQTVYFTSGPLVQEATFDHYEGNVCVLQSTNGVVKIRKGRVFTAQEASEKGLLDNGAVTRIKEAFAV